MADNWDVTGQEQRTTLGPAGRFQEVIEVHFVTKPHGVAGSVQIPVSSYSAESVRELIDARAAVIDGVANL